MSATSPRFWATPLRYCRWASRERPAYFWSVVIGACGPLTLVTVPPLRRLLGDHDAKPIPLTYPVPSGPRKTLTGYDDDTE
ncbi:n19m, NADH-ubiquinone oxidoreductase 9.5 kDa subunit [Madurella fahalii]|uniref:N19m, NADH-ubiquinone oxidoreductase 9.5 kDa subunit n=1 Tax=Madurella fahalii TaxID=1157608 RepID=A0ABQ0G1X2_9PEZI